MYGVALEGGGMKGAYHIGAMKAIFECGFEIGGYVGTSIGSFNAAVLAQGDFEILYDKWYNGSSSLGLNLEEQQLEKLMNKQVDIKGVKYWTKFVIDGITSKGLDSNKLKELYATYIDEEKLRKSKMDYGLVTVSLTDKKPVYLLKEDIPQGEVVNYVLASSYLPVFKQESMANTNKKYLDGGFYDNCPIMLLKEKGYKDIIEIKTGAIGISRKIDTKGLNIITISPSKEVGGIMFSDNNTVRNSISAGYFDALRVIKGYIGDKFYVVPTKPEKVFNALLNLTDEQILNIVEGTKISKIEKTEPKKILFEKVFPQIQSKIKNKDMSTYEKAIVAMIEHITQDEIQVFKLYTFEELLREFKKKIPSLLKSKRDEIINNDVNMMILKLLRHVEI